MSGFELTPSPGQPCSGARKSLSPGPLGTGRVGSPLPPRPGGTPDHVGKGEPERSLEAQWHAASFRKSWGERDREAATCQRREHLTDDDCLTREAGEELVHVRALPGLAGLA